MSKDRNQYVNWRYMDKEKLAELEAAAAAAKAEADAAEGKDESLNQSLIDANAAVEEAKKALETADKGVDFNKELEDLEAKLPPKRSEEEKAKYTMDKIVERFPNLAPKADSFGFDVEEPTEKLRKEMLRNQVEGIIRQHSKTEDEVKYKMHFYDHKVVKSGNIYDDADNAEWLANKNRTRNAIEEMRRTPSDPGSSSGAGAKGASNNIVELPSDQIQRLLSLGLKRVAPDRFEGTKTGLQYNKQTKTWEQFRK